MSKYKQGVINYLIRHDKDKIFIGIYIFLGFGLSLFLNLGFFIAIVLIHFFMDVVKYFHTIEEELIHHKKIARAIKLSFIEDLTDFAFIFIGIVTEVYLHFTFGLSIGRSIRELELIRVTEALPRLATLERTARYFKYLVHLGSYITYEKISKKLEKLSIIAIIICIILILASPLILKEPFLLIWANYIKKEVIPSLAPRF